MVKLRRRRSFNEIPNSEFFLQFSTDCILLCRRARKAKEIRSNIGISYLVVVVDEGSVESEFGAKLFSP